MSTSEVTLIPYVTTYHEVSAESVEADAEQSLQQAKNLQCPGMSRQIDATVRKIELTLNYMKLGLLSPSDAKAKIDTHLQTISTIYNRFQSQCVQYDAEKRNLGEQFRQTQPFRGTSIPSITQPEPRPHKTGRELLAEGVEAAKKKADTSLAASIQAMNAMNVRESMVRADILATALRGIAAFLPESPLEQVCRLSSKVGRRPGHKDDKPSEPATKPHALINRLRELGISEQEATQYFADSQLITKTAAATAAGLGAIRLGSQALPAFTAKVSNFISRFTAKNPPPLPKGPRTIVLERTSTTTPAPFNPMRQTVAEFEEHTNVSFEYMRLSETTSTAYVKIIADLNKSGTAINTINRLKQLAEQHGSSDLIVQALVQNERLLSILKTRYTYLGKQANKIYPPRGEIYDTFLVPLK